MEYSAYQSANAPPAYPQNTPTVLLSQTDYQNLVAFANTNSWAIALCNANAEIERMRYREAQRQNREEAYATSFDMNGQTCTMGSNAVPQELMDTTVNDAYLFFPEPPLSSDKFYVIFVGKADLLLIRGCRQ